ncbi:MAG: hypothetical protein OWS74_01200, partial [Firmicutes bacterium]|nr:hypothetical protein [Bacillota bacterium]
MQMKPHRSLKGNVVPRTKMHIPALLYLILLTQIPFVYALWLSLHSWNLIEPALGKPLVWFANYTHELLHSATFWPIVGNTIKLVLGSLVIAVVVGTIFALLLHRKFRGQGFLRAMIMIP